MVKSDHTQRIPAHVFLYVGLPSQTSRTINKRVISTFKFGYTHLTLKAGSIDEIALSRTVKEIVENLCFAIFGKHLKIQNDRHFWGGEIFLKIAKSTFLRYPMGRKFRQNRCISHG